MRTRRRRGHLSGADAGQSSPPQSEIESSRDQELTDLGAPVMSSTVGSWPRRLGCPVSTRLYRDFLIRSGRGWLNPAVDPGRPSRSRCLPYVEESVPMRVVVMTARGEVQVEDRADPTIQKPSYAIIGCLQSVSAGPICGLTAGLRRWTATPDGSRVPRHPGRGRIGGLQCEAGPVRRRFVLASDNTCEICGSDGYKAMDERRAIPPMTDFSETSRTVFRRSLFPHRPRHG